ncbi:MAG: phosphatase PAP2 family protein [Anaerolineales bacterium]|nr:phosphatase PAP2 family protein [Anaerolineales bacterium]
MNLRRILEKDAALSCALQLRSRSFPMYPAAVFFAHAGDSWFCLLVLLLIYIFAGPVWKVRTGTMGIVVFELALMVVVLKLLFKRRRPPGEWGQIYRSTDPHSFPSGHAARTFLLATLAVSFGPPWLAVVLWIWAPLVSLSRIALGVHYVSDIVAGIALGIATAAVFMMLLPAFEPALNAFLLSPFK